MNSLNFAYSNILQSLSESNAIHLVPPIFSIVEHNSTRAGTGIGFAPFSVAETLLGRHPIIYKPEKAKGSTADLNLLFPEQLELCVVTPTKKVKS